MPRKERKGPPTISATQVTIRCFPFVGCKPVVAWIAEGRLATVAGIPALSCPLEIDRPPNDDPRFTDYLTACECIRKQGYRSAAAVMPNGSKLAL